MESYSPTSTRKRCRWNIFTTIASTRPMTSFLATVDHLRHESARRHRHGRPLSGRGRGRLHRKPETVDARLLEQLAGTYEAPSGVHFRVSLEGGRLHTAFPGQPADELLPYKGLKFKVLHNADTVVEFIVNGQVKALKQIDPSGVFHCARKSSTTSGGRGTGKGRHTQARRGEGRLADGEALIGTQQLYDIEGRAQGLSADSARALRQAAALPIRARRKARFDEVRPTLRPQAKLATAIDYVLHLRSGRRYCT